METFNLTLIGTKHILPEEKLVTSFLVNQGKYTLLEGGQFLLKNFMGEA